MRSAFLAVLAVFAGVGALPHAADADPAGDPPPVIPFGTRGQLSLDVVHCGIDCCLAEILLPHAMVVSRELVFIAPATKPTDAAVIADAEIGGQPLPSKGVVARWNEARTGAGLLFVPVVIDPSQMLPDHYVGSIRLLFGPSSEVLVPLDIRVRGGPLVPLLWIAAGVLLGLTAKYWNERGQRQAQLLQKLEVLEAAIGRDVDADRKLLEPMLLEVREDIYRELDRATSQLAAIETRRESLAKLRRYEQVLGPIDDIVRARRLVTLRDDDAVAAALDRLAAMVSPAPPAKPGDGTAPGFGAGEGDDEPRVKKGKLTAFDWLAFRAQAGRLFIGPMLRWVLVLLIILLGFKTLYLDGGATYGARPLYDGLALLFWGLSAEVTGRTLTSLGSLLGPRVPVNVTAGGSASLRQGDARALRRASLPPFEVEKPDPSRGPSGPVSFEKGRWPFDGLGLDQLRAGGFTGAGVRIAVIDTGLQSGLGWNNVVVRDIDPGGGGEDLHDKAHGTRMAAILASDVGICPASTVVSIRALDFEGQGSAADLVAGIRLAVKLHCDVIAISAAQSEPDEDLAAAVANAVEHGAVIVAAINNQLPRGDAYPARYPGCISITPMKAKDALLYPKPPAWVSLAAPGKAIPTRDRGGVAHITGASPATAITAGICALLLGKRDRGPARMELARSLAVELRAAGDKVEGCAVLTPLAVLAKLQG